MCVEMIFITFITTLVKLVCNFFYSKICSNFNNNTSLDGCIKWRDSQVLREQKRKKEKKEAYYYIIHDDFFLTKAKKSVLHHL
jgi:hypothetical protein